MSNEVFAQRLRVALASANLTQSALAVACGVTQAAVSRWANGTSYPRSSHLSTISNLTGASIEWLMSPEPFEMKEVSQAADNAMNIRKAIWHLEEALK